MHIGRALLGVLFVILVWLFVCGILIGRLMSGADIRFVAVGMTVTCAVGVYASHRLVRRLPRKRTCNHDVYRAVRRLAQSDCCSLLRIEGEQLVELTIDHEGDLARIVCQNWRIQGPRSENTSTVLYIIHSDGIVKKSRMTPSVVAPLGRESTTLTVHELDQLLETLDTYPLQMANT